MFCGSWKPERRLKSRSRNIQWSARPYMSEDRRVNEAGRYLCIPMWVWLLFGKDDRSDVAGIQSYSGSRING